MNNCTPLSWRINRPATRRHGLFPFAIDNDMGRLLNDFLGVGETVANAGGSTPQEFVPALTVHEDKDQYLVTAEVPGVQEKDIEISLADGILTVSGEKRAEVEKTEGKTHFVSRRFGSFSRQIYLESSVDEEKIDAVVKDGVLTVKLPKASKADEKVKKVTVRSER